LEHITKRGQNAIIDQSIKVGIGKMKQHISPLLQCRVEKGF
jgi:hypothetical protein